MFVCEAVSDDEAVPEPLGEPSCVALGEDVLCCEVDCVCVRLSDATCEGVIVRVRPPETVSVGETLAVTDTEGVAVPDADPVSLRLWVSLGVGEIDGVEDALPVGPWLSVCVVLWVAAWLGDWVTLLVEF